MFLTWKFRTFATRVSLYVNAFDVWALVLFSGASFAVFRNVDSARATVNPAFTDEVFVKLQIRSSAAFAY